jgi:hypothetical protein
MLSNFETHLLWVEARVLLSNSFRQKPKELWELSRMFDY